MPSMFNAFSSEFVNLIVLVSVSDGPGNFELQVKVENIV